MKKFLLTLLLTLTMVPTYAIYFDDDAIEQGYRGFGDFYYTLGVGEGNGADRVGLMTSHGYQIAPQFFIGAGVGFNYYYDADKFNLPIFLHLRSDILNNDVTPFVELRVGYSVLDVKGFYLNPSLGCRFKLNDSLGLNLSVGYTMQKYSYYRGWNKNKINIGGIDFRVGLDF